MEGKVVLITGSTSGLGLQSAKELLAMGATVILTCRDELRGRKTVEELHSLHAAPLNGRIHLFSLDLMSYQSVIDFCAEIQNQFDHIDILICNAGIMGKSFELSSDGIESHFATNMFGHFILVTRLIKLLEAVSGRIIVVSSGLYKQVNSMPTMRQLMGEQTWDYDGRFAYAFSKLANCLFAVELARRLRLNRSPVTIYAVRPGFVRGTELGRETHWLLRHLAAPVIWLFSHSLEQGVEPIIFCAKTSVDELDSDHLYNFHCQLEEFSPLVNDSNTCWIWNTCCQMEDLVLKRGHYSSDAIQSAKSARNQLQI